MGLEEPWRFYQNLVHSDIEKYDNSNAQTSNISVKFPESSTWGPNGYQWSKVSLYELKFKTLLEDVL